MNRLMDVFILLNNIYFQIDLITITDPHGYKIKEWANVDTEAGKIGDLVAIIYIFYYHLMKALYYGTVQVFDQFRIFLNKVYRNTLKYINFYMKIVIQQVPICKGLNLIIFNIIRL